MNIWYQDRLKEHLAELEWKETNHNYELFCMEVQFVVGAKYSVKPDLPQALIGLLLDPALEEPLRNKVRQWLLKVPFHGYSRQAAFIQIWAETRDPQLESLFTQLHWESYLHAYEAEDALWLLKLNRIEDLQPEEYFSSAIQKIVWLEKASEDRDPQIAERAEALLAVWDEWLVQNWVQITVRNQDYLDLVEKRGLALPAHAQLAYDLLKNQWEKWMALPPELLPNLLEMLDRYNLQENAHNLLLNLELPQTQQALCLAVIAEPDDYEDEEVTGVLDEIVVEAGYRPDGLPAYQQALFYFLTEQWESYDAIDFDCRMLRAVYQEAGQLRRRRIAELVRNTGRVDYLAILPPPAQADQPVEYNSEETAVTVELLAENREWARLWQLATELPLEWSLYLVRLLETENKGWRPAERSDRALFEKLRNLARQLKVDSLNEIKIPAGQEETVQPWLERPLAAFEPGQLGEIHQWRSTQQPEARLQVALRYLETILAHRFRHAIELGEVEFEPGEFDIEIEPASF